MELVLKDASEGFFKGALGAPEEAEMYLSERHAHMLRVVSSKSNSIPRAYEYGLTAGYYALLGWQRRELSRRRQLAAFPADEERRVFRAQVVLGLMNQAFLFLAEIDRGLDTYAPANPRERIEVTIPAVRKYLTGEAVESIAASSGVKVNTVEQWKRRLVARLRGQWLISAECAEWAFRQGRWSA